MSDFVWFAGLSVEEGSFVLVVYGWKLGVFDQKAKRVAILGGLISEMDGSDVDLDVVKKFFDDFLDGSTFLLLFFFVFLLHFGMILFDDLFDHTFLFIHEDCIEIEILFGSKQSINISQVKG